MYFLITAIHFLLCISLIVLVLIQQGKGADMGAAFGGGGSNTFFGASGATAFITKLTTGIAVAFMVTSIGLIYFDPVSSGGAPISLFPASDRVQDLIDARAPKEAPPAPVENSDKK